MLSRLAQERATGVLTRERGVLYLVEGQVVHAESPATPGLDVLLTSRGALGSEGWWEAVSQAGAERRVGRFLVDSGRLAAGALELCHLGALYDAAFFTLGTSSGPARFRYGVAHWIGPVRPVSVDAVERETLRRRALLHRIWPDADTDTAELVRTDRAVDAVLPPRQRTVLDQVDGVRTVADISLVLGRPGFHTLVDVRRLAAAGIVTTRARTVEVREPQPAASDPSTTSTPSTTSAPPTAPDPSTAAVSTAPDPAATERAARAAQAAEAAQASAEPDVALLRRLRDALEAL
ncbi:transcriptional regulator [Streptomyces apricus]|uniref:Transcriptional regulator n=1 Tax=Streptomyces apricus TaxID=1828112 RepID=A0A5B0ANW4_9ACTN|nr:transcriptional regulator [Streptomyces apricus]KAA0930762.1 transcriptional regulator [Streptomyces apricus]